MPQRPCCAQKVCVEKLDVGFDGRCGAAFAKVAFAPGEGHWHMCNDMELLLTSLAMSIFRNNMLVSVEMPIFRPTKHRQVPKLHELDVYLSSLWF